jgi:hypothetical protein
MNTPIRRTWPNHYNVIASICATFGLSRDDRVALKIQILHAQPHTSKMRIPVP